MSEETVAFIDLGSNSVRLLLARVGEGHRYTVLTRQKETIRLGDGAFEEQRLQPDAIERAATVCHHFASMARANGARLISAVATAACREAKNRQVLVNRLRRESGLDLRVVSGKEEARLIYLGVSSGLRLGEKKAVFIDVGGGSTEVIYGDQQSYDFIDSFDLGAIRLTNRFFGPDDTGPVDDARYAEVATEARNKMIRAISDLKRRPTDLAIGSSGTAENLADVAAHLSLGRAVGRDDVIPYDAIRAAIDHMRRLPLEQRRKVTGLSTNRADIIIAGAAIIESLMRSLNIEGLRVSDRGLLDGLLVDWLDRQEHPRVSSHDSLRDRSVHHLAESCRYDEPHARHVARLAEMLFESSRDEGLHRLGDEEQELLYHAAILHDIGSFLSYKNHHEHTYYFVRNADLLGFDQTEIEIIATTARFHQKTTPNKRFPSFASLDRRSQLVVRRLSVMLRIAESLDRTHTGVIQEAWIVAGSKKRIAKLVLHAKGPCDLELRAVRRHEKVFRKTFRRDLEIEVIDESGVAADGSPGAQATA
ncbi:MAG: HD domain-containing protein [Phycisphaerales bacterium]